MPRRRRPRRRKAIERVATSSQPLSASEVKATLSANAEDHNLASNVPYAIAPQYPVQSESFDYEVGASYTYWVPYQNGMILGYYNGDADARGNYFEPYTQGQSGFKLRIGIVTPHDGWSAFINYAWFNNDNKFKTATIDLPHLYLSLPCRRWRA